MTREVTLYTRRLCGLCDEAALELRALKRRLRFTLHEVDIDANPALRDEYDEVVPIVTVGGHVVARAPIDPARLRAMLERALDPEASEGCDAGACGSSLD